MIGIKINIQAAGARAELAALLAKTRRPEAMLKVVGRRGANELKTHFRMRNRTGNKLGGRRTNFWQAVADSVQNPRLVNPSTIEIAINDPRFAQRLFGGTISAKVARRLTIPRDPLAHGRTVTVFQRETGIRLFRLRKKGGVLSNALAGLHNGSLTVFYVLRDSVEQDPDPEALPPQETFDAALIGTARDYYARESARSTP